MARVDQMQPVTGDAVYGEGIATGEMGGLGEYAVITSRTPWELHREMLSPEPQAVLMPGTLEQAELDTLSAQLPAGARIVGLGGGAVLDAAKFFARLRGETPILVPTVASSNGPFSDWISVRKNGRPSGFREPGMPRRVVVDYALIQKGSARLNRAGYGDLLPLQTTLNDWRMAAAASRADPVDPDIEAAGEEVMRQAMSEARDIGSLSRQGIEVLMRLTEVSTALMLTHDSRPLNAGSEHLFAWTLESLTGRHFIHGEIVALGIVISSWLQGRDHVALTNALNDARVTYHPERLGIEWSEIESTLLGVNEYNRSVRQFNTVYDDVTWTPDLLREVRDVVYASPSVRM